MVAKLSCGEGFARGKADPARAIERKDVIVRNSVYYKPTHTLEVAELHSAVVEGPIAIQLEGTEVQTVTDKFWANAEDPYKGPCQSYNPAPPATLQLTDKHHNEAADAAASVGSTALDPGGCASGASRSSSPRVDLKLLGSSSSESSRSAH